MATTIASIPDHRQRFYEWRVHQAARCHQPACLCRPSLLETRVRRALWFSGYDTEAEVAAASDADLLWCKHIGPRYLQQIRVVLGAVWSACPHCHGTGRIWHEDR